MRNHSPCCQARKALLERVGQRYGVRVRVEGRRVAVGLCERLRERPLGQPGSLVEHLSHRLGVEVAELPGRQHFFQVEDLVEVELEVAHVALVVPHTPRLSPSNSAPEPSFECRSVTNEPGRRRSGTK